MATTTTKSKRRRGAARLAADGKQHCARRPRRGDKIPPAGRPDFDAVQERRRVRGGMVAMARREAQRLRQFRLVRQPDHHGGDARALRRRRNHRADADVDFRHRVGLAKRLRPGVRGHQSAHARHGHEAGRQKNLQKDARGFPDAHPGLQRARRLSAGGIEEAQHSAHRGRLRIARRDIQGAESSARSGSPRIFRSITPIT